MKLFYTFLLVFTMGISASFSQSQVDSLTNVPMDTTVFYKDSLKFYDFISPNGDNKNDNFVIEFIQYFPNSTLLVYNVWGQMVYKNNDYRNEFNGIGNVGFKIAGNELPDGVYYYTLIDTLKKKHTGKITIKR